MIFPEKFPENQKYDNSKEKLFYYRFLKELPEDWDVFYSFKFINPGLPIRELDYIILCPLGIFIIELKNAKFRVNQGKWLIYDSRERRWKEHKKNQYSGPVEQVETAVSMFKEFLTYNNHLISPVEPDSISGGVFLNKNEVGQVYKKTYGRDYLVFHKELEERSLLDILSDLQDRLKCHPPTKLQREKVKQIILLNGNYYPGFQVRRNIQQRILYALTSEQMKIVDGIKEHPRLLISGVVGSGKSLMAQHSVEVGIKNNWKMLFLCSSDFLAERMKTNFPDEPNLEVSTFYNFLFTGGNSDFYDMIIIDESQNIISGDFSLMLDRKLKSGLLNGKWVIFMDSEQRVSEFQSGFLRSFADIPHEKFFLSSNIRNPSEIYSVALALGGKRMMDTSVPDALNVKFVKYYTAIEARLKLFDLVDYGVKQLRLLPDEIVILSPHTFDKTVEIQNLSDLVSGNNNPERYELAVSKDGVQPEGKILVSTINEYQGLEASFVILTGITSLEDENLRTEYYIALTRSNYIAGILYSETQTEKMQEIFRF